MIKSWVFEFVHAAGSDTEILEPGFTARTYADCFDIWKQAETLGFEGIFFSEHHFQLSYSPSPNLLVAAAARETSRLRLGVMGVVLPFYPPWRVVEEMFMLDHISGGRLEIGCALGVPQELARVGIAPDEARERYEEALRFLDLALREPVFSFEGKFWSVENLSIVPRSLQQPLPPVWTPVLSDNSARQAARRQSKISTGFESVDRIRTLFDVYRAEADALGYRAGSGDLAIRRNVSVAATSAEAQEAADIAKNVSRKLMAGDTRVTRLDSASLDAPKKESGFTIHPDEYVVGTPSQVAEQIIDQCRTCGAGHFFGTLGRGLGVRRRDAVMLFGEKVVPALLKA